MSNIEYDNFPKFLVSFGMLMFALPFIVVLFFLQENSVLLVSEESMSGLTEIARATIYTKQQISSRLACSIPYIFVVCIITGAILFYFGCKNWNSQQKIIDKLQLIECEQAIYEWEKKSQAEKQAEVEKEMSKKEKMQTDLSIEEIQSKQNAIKKEKNEIRKQIIKRYVEVEQDVVEAIKRNLGDDFKVSKNARIGGVNTHYDAIAESIFDEQSYIFEIKYVCSVYSWNANMWNMIPVKMRGFVEAYEQKTSRKARPVLLIVVADNQEEQAVKIKRNAQRRWAAEKDLIVNVFTEANIDKLTKTDMIENGILC